MPTQSWHLYCYVFGHDFAFLKQTNASMRILLHQFPQLWKALLSEIILDKGYSVWTEAQNGEQYDVVFLYAKCDAHLKSVQVPSLGEFTVLMLEMTDDDCGDLTQVIPENIHFVFHATENRTLLRVYLRSILKTAYYQQDLQNSADALAASEAKADAILKSTISGIITIDEHGTIESFNPAAERIFGYTADEVIGVNVSILMPQPFRREHNTYIDHYLKTKEARIIGIGREVVGMRKNGETFPLELAVNDVKLPNRRIFSGIVRDISGRRELERALLSISEHERRNIGQELHDGLGQMLTGIGLLTDNLRFLLENEGSKHTSTADKILKYIEEADTFARLLSRGLVPVQLENNGLATALFRLCEQMQKRLSVTCTFEALGDAPTFHHEDAIQLYRIAQEAMNNAIKHGKATQIHVVFAVGDNQARLRVQNNGVSFPEILPEKRGMGLDIMAYRAKLLSASLDIKVAPKGGTILTCTIPLNS